MIFLKNLKDFFHEVSCHFYLLLSIALKVLFQSDLRIDFST
jgi:hypothetical protein